MDNNATVPGGGKDSSYTLALWNLVIRPPRSTYDVADLGPTEFTARGVRATRHDVRLRTGRGTWLQCSHFVPRQDRRKALRKFPVIIYLHGNASSRLEGVNLVGPLIGQRISLFCFDSAGCGLSEGDYVSLGWHERDDLATVIEHLRKSPFCGPVGVWGRSMGAVTALLHADRDPTLDAVCFDSPFASLRQLAEELAVGARYALFPLPSWLIAATLAVIRMRVKALANFDIEDLVPLEHAKRSVVPAIFMHARQDKFISPEHSRQLYQAYRGAKQLVTIEGDHNTERSEEVVNHAVNFFRRTFGLDSEELDLSVPRHLVDADLAVPKQDGQPRHIPPLPLPVMQRCATRSPTDEEASDATAAVAVEAAPLVATGKGRRDGAPLAALSSPGPLSPPKRRTNRAASGGG